MTEFKTPAERILTLADAVRYREELRRAGKKLVVTNGCFDILHRGHATYLDESRKLGDALLMLVNSDESVRALKGPSRPVTDQYSRAFLLCSLRAVDAAVIFPASRCAAELAALQPDIYVKGGDYTIASLDPEERAALLAAGTQIVFKPFVPGFSTTSILEKMK
ncbi:MAG: adenylyltransferase/cytidyltransferase family protein [Victivallaceae bacterium]